MVTALTLHKGMCKRVIRDLGIPTPDFRVIESARDLESASLAYPLFVKPVAEGTAKGISSASKIDTFEELKRVAGELLVSYHQPVLVETYLPGREFTVGIVGTGPTARSVGVLEVKVKTDDGIYSYESKEHYEEMVEYTLLKGAPDLHSKMESIALEAWRGLGCRDGGRIDLRLDQNGSPMFLEVNPLAGLHPFHSDLPIMCTHAGISYYTLISWIMSSAIERVEDARRSAA
jgi:D-alanine-D-alanine ligase